MRKAVKDLDTNITTTHTYRLDGTKIIREIINYTGVAPFDEIFYYYDTNGAVVGFRYNGTSYYYGKNVQGDIIGIYDANGTELVRYEYGAYGEVLSVTGSSASTLGQINPFRYRGYYYDTESGLYYLNSRYYDPVVGRFLNADIQFDDGAVLHGYNLFAYCADNPTNHLDYFGKSTTSVLDLWLKTGWVFAGADGPLPIGEGVYVIGIALLLLVSEFDPKPENFSNNITYLPNSHAIAPSLPAPNEPPTQPISVDDVIFKNNNPDPFARPGQKKQGRENKEKKKKSDNWKGNPNKRIKKPKKHTPGRDHRKY